MKNLILTTAVLLYLLTMAVLMGQVDRAILTHRQLEHTAEEAALAAVLSGLPEDRNGEVSLQFVVCEEVAQKTVQQNVASKDTELHLEIKEKEYPTVQVHLRKGRVRAEAGYELVWTDAGWRPRRMQPTESTN